MALRDLGIPEERVMAHIEIPSKRKSTGFVVAKKASHGLGMSLSYGSSAPALIPDATPRVYPV